MIAKAIDDNWHALLLQSKSFFLIQLEEFHSKAAGESVYLLLMVALALEEEAEVGDQQYAAEEGKEDPKGRESD